MIIIHKTYNYEKILKKNQLANVYQRKPTNPTTIDNNEPTI